MTPTLHTERDSTVLPADADLDAVLEAWSQATARLQGTHEVLTREVARLTDELERKNRALERKDRLADLGRMAAHVAHEVRNSLVPVTLYLSLLKRRLSDDSGSLDILTKLEAGFTALDATVNDLLGFTSRHEPRRENVVVSQLVGEIVDSVAPQLAAQGIRSTVDVGASTVVSADREMLRRALLNLVLNAVDAMPEGGELVVTCFDGPAGVELEVADSGPGLTDEQKAKVFDPFFTTKNTGTGLGLAIVQRVADAHGGKATAMNCPEGGAAFTLQLPRVAMRAAA